MPPGSDLSIYLGDKELIEGLALEVFLHHCEETWVVAPERFFKNPISQPAHLSSTPPVPGVAPLHIPSPYT